MSKTERLLAAVADMQHYVVHDVDQSKCAACPRWDELQSAAMAAAGQIDALNAELAALRAELESAHAAQRHAEKELSQYMAWYAMAEQERGHQYRRAEKAEAERDSLRAAIEDGPHDYDCATLIDWHQQAGGYRILDNDKCNCWKRAALEAK